MPAQSLTDPLSSYGGGLFRRIWDTLWTRHIQHGFWFLPQCFSSSRASLSLSGKRCSGPNHPILASLRGIEEAQRMEDQIGVSRLGQSPQRVGLDVAGKLHGSDTSTEGFAN